MTDTDTRDTYGQGDTSDQPSTACYSCQGSGFREVLTRGQGVVHPCRACRPYTYARWLAGHLGCRAKDCPVCHQLASEHADHPGSRPYRDAPAGGRAWVD